jgi:hypothetical protein
MTEILPGRGTTSEALISQVFDTKQVLMQELAERV